MKYSSIPPGDDPGADAYNLMVCAWTSQFTPGAVTAAQTMARTLTAKITNWEEVAAHLAILASQFADFCDRAMPEEVDGKKYERPSEKVRLLVEQREMQPV